MGCMTPKPTKRDDDFSSVIFFNQKESELMEEMEKRMK